MHFVAHLKIERVDHLKTTQQRGLTTTASDSPKREITEVTQLTIKADTLEKLVTKLGKHIEIIEE